MILVIGAGVAGISCAVSAAERGAEVLLVTPGEIDIERNVASSLAGGNTAMAQGGIAAAIGREDRVESHVSDTLSAGAGLVDAEAADLLCREGASHIKDLIVGGFAVDRDARGDVSLGLEAAHSRARIVHAGEDRTGAALHSFLVTRLIDFVRDGRIALAQQSKVAALLTDAGAVSGALLRGSQGVLSAVKAKSVVLATGGYGGLYARTSNHSGARGQGIALAARAGAVVSDLEFVQFHPTVIAGTGNLISEAVRGAGAVLRDDSGVRFMSGAHPAAELAPRDVVSRVAHGVLAGGSQVWLDATGIEREGGHGTLAKRFPAISAVTRSLGVDWAEQPIAVTPAAHYTMGGVVTDLEGRTSVPGLFAAGEVASTGVHGANRLASNSLLEGIVFGTRAGNAAASHAMQTDGARPWNLKGRAASLVTGAESAQLRVSQPTEVAGMSEFVRSAQPSTDRGDELGQAFDRFLGIQRCEEGLREMMQLTEASTGEAAELGQMIAIAADARRESRGAHQRTDCPETDRAQASRRAWRFTPAQGSANLASAAIRNLKNEQSEGARSVQAC